MIQNQQAMILSPYMALYDMSFKYFLDMAPEEQREFMYHQIRKFRSTKPLFTMDFWNDGEYVSGRIEGGCCLMQMETLSIVHLFITLIPVFIIKHY